MKIKKITTLNDFGNECCGPDTCLPCVDMCSPDLQCEPDEKESGCYLTSACIEYAGLSDDCYELETLRKGLVNFRVKNL